MGHELDGFADVDSTLLNELKVMVTVLMMRMNMMKTTIVVIVMMMTSCIKPGTSLTISLCSTSNITT